MSYIVMIPKRGRDREAISFREKVEMLARCKLNSEDANTVVPPVYLRHGLTPPKYAAQALSGFATRFKNAVAKGDPEAIRLAKEFGFELRENASVAAAPQSSAADAKVT